MYQWSNNICGPTDVKPWQTERSIMKTILSSFFSVFDYRCLQFNNVVQEGRVSSADLYTAANWYDFIFQFNIKFLEH